MSRQYRTNAIIAQTPAADYKASRGYLVDLAAGTATVSSSATIAAKGVILDGIFINAGSTTEKVSVGILGAIAGTVPMRLSGTVAAGAFVVQSTDGTVITDPGTGARNVVGVAIEGGGTGENIEVASITPRYFSA